MREKLYRTKKELEIQYGLNSKEIRKLNEKIKVLNSNLIEGKFYIFAKSLAVSFPILMILSIIVATISPSLLFSIISRDPLCMMRRLFVGSIISGVIVERTISRVNHKKLNRFSSAKTDEEKREEICVYKLEKEKINDKNNTINKAYEFASELETKVGVCNLDFGNSNMSKEEQEMNNNKLMENVKIKEKELETLSTQHYLNKEFVMLRSKLGKLGNIGLPFIVGVVTSLYAFIGTFIVEPSFIYESPATVGHIINTITLGSGAIGAGASAIATGLRRKQDRRIFNKINSRLGEDKLPENTDSDIKEGRKIVTKGNKVIDELATAHLVYQDSTRELERFIDTETIEEETALDVAIRGAKKLDKLNLKGEPDERMQTIVQVAHQEETKEAEGPTKVKRK